MHHGGRDAAVARGKGGGEGAGARVEVPVERLRHQQALRVGQADRMHVGDEAQQARQALPASGDAELGGLLHQGFKRRPGAGEADHLGAAGPRLQQQGGEVQGLVRECGRSQHAPAGGFHHGGDVALQGVAEGVVGREEEPGVAALRQQGRGRAGGQRRRVVRPLQGVRAARGAGQRGGAGAAEQGDAVAVARPLRDRQRGGGVRHVQHRVHAVPVEPCAREACADIRAVSHVRRQDFDRKVRPRLHRHAGGDHRALPGAVRRRAGQGGEHADAERPGLRARRSRQAGEGSGKKGPAGQGHGVLSARTPPARPWPSEARGWRMAVGALDYKVTHRHAPCRGPGDAPC